MRVHTLRMGLTGQMPPTGQGRACYLLFGVGSIPVSRFWVSPLGTLLGHLRDAPGLLWTQGCLPSYSSIRKVAHEGEERREELWGPSMQTRIADALKGPHGRKLLRRQQFQKMEPASRGRAENKLPSVLPSQTILLTSAALGGL